MANKYLPLDGGTVTGHTSFEDSLGVINLVMLYDEEKKALTFAFKSEDVLSAQNTSSNEEENV